MPSRTGTVSVEEFSVVLEGGVATAEQVLGLVQRRIPRAATLALTFVAKGYCWGQAATDEVGDAVAEEIFERRAVYDPERGDVDGWLFGIACNEARSWVRKKINWINISERVAFELRCLRDDKWDPEALKSLATEQKVDQAREALALLSEPDREIIFLRARDGLTFEEIATRLKISSPTARQRHGRAVERLRKTRKELE